MHVIWARGQEPGHYVHSPPSGLEKGTAATGDFYRQDELKYHGHGNQRGFTTINFFEETKSSINGGVLPLANNKVGGQWGFPAHCWVGNASASCEYHASWEYLGRKRGKDSVRFTITTKHTQHWTGIGFSKDKKMSQTDAIIGWVDPLRGRPFIMDTWVSGYSAPRVDAEQDLSKETVTLVDGVTTMSFVRKRDTGKAQDLAFTDTQCLYMMFIVQGGNFDAVNKRTSKHLQTPVVSSEKVCIVPGNEPEEEIEEESATEPVIPGMKSYSMLIRITNLAESFKPPAQGSKEYEELAQQVLDSLTKELSRNQGYHGVKVDGFMQNETKSIIAELTLKSIESNSIEGSSGRSLDAVSLAPNATEQDGDRGKWERVVRHTLALAKVGNLNVDPDFLVFEPQGLVSSSIPPSSKSDVTYFGLAETKLYVVVSCVAALVLVALLQAVCTLYRTRAKKTKEQLISNSAWKDYSKTNYAFEPFENDKFSANGTASTARVPLSGGRERERERTSRPSEPPPPRPTAHNHHHNTIEMRPNGNGTARRETRDMRDGRDGRDGREGRDMRDGREGRDVRDAREARDTRSLQRHTHLQPRHYGYPENGHRATYSLPRGGGGGGRMDPKVGVADHPDHPDFYFMPSQRKYEGEVVRVYVRSMSRPD